MKYFCISDVHSFYQKTIEALNKAGYDRNNIEHTLVLCGDAFDRGEDSVGMFNFLKSLPQDRFIYVRGNHEDLLKQAVDEIVRTGEFSYHHYTNGTINTIYDFTKIGIYDLPFMRNDVEKKMKPILDWLDTKCVDYFETGHYVFVHGWLPCKRSDPNMYHSLKVKFTLDENWRDGDWESARWYNGMDAWNQGAHPKDKTVICGHWHCSWGWSNIDQKRKEFPPKNHIDWEKSFEPYVKEGIFAIDACTAYSGIVNVLVLED